MQGTFTGTGRSATFIPKQGSAFNISVWGTFSGSLQLERSFDNGTTWLPLTASGTQLYVWTAPASELAAEPMPGVQYSLNCTAYSSGAINYLMGGAQ